MIILGSIVLYKSLGDGQFECPKCLQQRTYSRKRATRYLVFLIPLFPIEDPYEVIECRTCWSIFNPVVLVKPGDASAVDAFIADLRHRDHRVRGIAVLALGKIGEPAVKPLITALDDEDWNTRREAADALGRTGDPRAIKPLIAALQDKELSVRATAAEALGRLGDPRAIEPLTAALGDRDLQFAAGEALAKIRQSIDR